MSNDLINNITEYVPITVEITDDYHTDITVRFKAVYRKHKKSKNYIGDGYVGERFANERL